MRRLPEIESLRNALEDCRALLWDLKCIRGMERHRTTVAKLEKILDDEVNAALVELADETLAEDGGKCL